MADSEQEGNVEDKEAVDGDTSKEETEKKKGKKGKSDGDMLSPAAMDNVYYGCHNVQELLQARGYAPPGFAGKKKKGKK